SVAPTAEERITRGLQCDHSGRHTHPRSMAAYRRVVTDSQDRVTPPPPPRQDEYPQGALIAVVDDLPTGEAAVLAAQAWSASPPYLIEAVDVLRMRQARDEDQGLLKRLYLALGSMVS